MNEAEILEFFAQYAYQPYLVYTFIIAFMTASSFGLPVPEEVILVSAGLVAYMARNPMEFPPPTPDAEGVNLLVLAVVCTIAVLGSDLLIYFLGKFFGQKIIGTKFFNNNIGQERFNKINKVFKKYSYWACGLFRFTPGLRFPGHMSCGLMGIPLWQFIMVDGLAALFSVPTQVLLVAYNGKVILEKLREFKLALAAVIAVLIIFYFARRLVRLYQRKRAK